MIASPSSRNIYIGPAVFKLPSKPTDWPTTTEQTSSPLRRKVDRHGNKLSVDTGRAVNVVRGTYAKLVSPSGRTHDQSEQALTEVNTPKKVFKASRKDAFSDAADPVAVTDRLSGLVLRDPQRLARCAEHQRRRVEEGELGAKAFRDVAVASHLPKHLIDQIMSLALPEREFELMTEEQRDAVVHWGMRKETLKVGWAGRDLSSQAWMLLDSVKCLEYGQ